MATAKQRKAKAKRSRAPTPAELARLAIAGDVEALAHRTEAFSGDGSKDTLLYQWLTVAADFGRTAKQRKAADDLISDLLQSSMLRYDDEQIGTGGAHWALALAYLRGTDHLPRDLERATEQLEIARECYFPWSIQGATALIAKTRKTLDPEARATFDAIYDGTKPVQRSDEPDDDDV